jgi:hypothetical protein
MTFPAAAQGPAGGRLAPGRGVPSATVVNTVALGLAIVLFGHFSID